MNVMAISGSPRKGGNTETLLREAIRGTGLTDAKLYRLQEMHVEPCRSCGGCEKTGRCVVKDEFQDLYEAIIAADRIILASPIYFMSVSAQAKTLIDRCQAFWCRKYLLNQELEAGPHGRTGLLFLVGGMEREAGVKCAETVGTAFFRTVSVPAHSTLAYIGIDAKGEIEKHPTALADAFEAGRALVAV
jgi:multimeric flavodoxin WrbA